MASRLFEFIAARHEGPWGAVLDAGTGVHSAGWLAGLPTESLTLVTAAPAHADQVRRSVPLRPADRLLVGDWADPAFLAGESFDAVLADYLVGAVEAFAPYFQQALFDRLARLVRGRLYLIGVDPYVVAEPDTASGRLVWEIGRFRDACLLLAGDRPYREYPAEWVLAQLDRAGFAVIEARRFPIRYKAAFVDSQIDMALMRLPALPDPALAEALRARGEALRRAGLAAVAAKDGIRHGCDYVIVAERRP
ncbi:class I SAM-dependent methyltransferase [Phenylobacterium terrae]|uniref:Class I SAM-dependent methyltransferase n=1 Tax=Phenylobacterium terrae TaxID=2665495 RepID=A0ABW4MWT6_9CAUL